MARAFNVPGREVSNFKRAHFDRGEKDAGDSETFEERGSLKEF